MSQDADPQKTALRLVDELARALKVARPHDPRTLKKSDIPTDQGIYLWSRREGDAPVYLGRAARVRGGLRSRLSTHLRESPSDLVETSTLRFSISIHENLLPGKPVHEYLMSNLVVRWVVVPDLEASLIGKISPLYNRTGQMRAPRKVDVAAPANNGAEPMVAGNLVQLSDEQADRIWSSLKTAGIPAIHTVNDKHLYIRRPDGAIHNKRVPRKHFFLLASYELASIPYPKRSGRLKYLRNGGVFEWIRRNREQWE